MEGSRGKSGTSDGNPADGSTPVGPPRPKDVQVDANWDCATFNDGYLAMRRKKFISSRNCTAVLRVQARGTRRLVLAPFLPHCIVVRPTMNRPSTRTEIAIGRALASIVHPYAAWRTRSMKRRAFLIASYVAVGYAAGLALLLFRAPSAIW